jgi:hypothetical protein
MFSGKSFSAATSLVLLMVFSFAAISTLLSTAVLALTTSDNFYNLTFFKFDFDILRDSDTWVALLNSTLVSLVSTILAVIVLLVFGPYVINGSYRAILVFALPYMVNPAYRAAVYSELYDGSVTKLNLHPADLANDIFVPGVVLAFQYLPVLIILLRLGSTQSRQADIPKCSSALAILEVIPSALRLGPMLIALLYLLTLFDSWVVVVVAGNRRLYWGPMVLQQAYQARDIPGASQLVIIGLISVVISYLALWSVSVLCFWLLQRSSLGFIDRLRRNRRFLPVWMLFRRSLPLASIPLVVLLYYPVGKSLVYGLRGLEFEKIVGSRILSDVFDTAFLGMSVASLAVVLGLVVMLSSYRFPKIWFATAILALAPEPMFLLMGICSTNRGLVSPGFLLLLVIMLSYSAAICGHLFRDSLAAEPSRLSLLRVVSVNHILTAVRLITREFLSVCAITWCFIYWFTLEEVLIASTLSGPRLGVVSAKIYAEAKRGISPEGEATVLALMILNVIVLAVGSWIFQQTRHGKLEVTR